MRFAPIALVAALLLGACQRDEPVSAVNGWVRLPAVSGRPAAAYFTVTAHTAPERLVAVTTPIAGKVELHTSMDAQGRMAMRPLAAVDIPVGAPVRFQPGGHHAMLFDLNDAAAPGGETTLTLRFESGRTIDVPATLIAAGDATPEE